MAKPNPVVHFEMGYQDKDRMIKFYESVFGWKTQKMGPEMGNYVLAHTTETDDKGMVKTPGTINGGFYQKIENPLSHAPSVVVAVDDIRAAMKDIEAAGGKILGAMDESGKSSMEPQDIPGVGLWISVMDTEGNRLSILQPAPMMGNK
jgi:predicted enzyme related to lactoylglutathione lyase